MGPTPAGPNRITEDVKLQVPDRVQKYQSDRSADPRLNPQQIRKHQRRDDNSRDSVRTSSSRRAVTKTEVCLGRLTNPKSCPVQVDPRVPGIRTSEYVTRQFETTERSRTYKSRVQFFVPRWISIVVQNELTMHLTYVSILRLIKPKTHAFYGVQRCPTMSNVVQRRPTVSNGVRRCPTVSNVVPRCSPV